MESSGSSFIPQRPTGGKVAAKSFRKVYILSYISYLVFITVLLAVGGVFFYKVTLEGQLTTLQSELVSQKNAFNQTDLDRVRNLDNRIDAATELINNHVSLLLIFNALEQAVVEPVQLLSFEYNRNENIQQPLLTIEATAKEFDQVIFQEQVLNSSEITRRFSVADISLATVPIDETNLELGVDEVVQVTLEAELSVPEINFTGFTPVANVEPMLTDISTDVQPIESDTDGGFGEADDTVLDDMVEPLVEVDTSNDL